MGRGMRGRYFSLCADAGLTDEERHALQERVLGRPSVTGATDAEFHALITELEGAMPELTSQPRVSADASAKAGRPTTVNRFTTRYATDKVAGGFVRVVIDWKAVDLGYAIACEIIEHRNGLRKGQLSAKQRGAADRLCRAAAVAAATIAGRESELTRHLRKGARPVPPAAFLIEDPPRGIRELSVYLRTLRNQLAAEKKRQQRGNA